MLRGRGVQATQLPEPAAVPVQRPASPALAPALRTISGETPHYRARFEVAAADGADAAEADELDGEFSRRRWHTRIGLAPAGDGGCILNVQVSHYAVNGFF